MSNRPTPRKLTAEAQAARDMYIKLFAGTPCTCKPLHVCRQCDHPGNPKNQTDDHFYEPPPAPAVSDVVRDDIYNKRVGEW